MEKAVFESLCIECAEQILIKCVNKRVWIYGAGTGGKTLLHILNDKGIHVCGFYDINASEIGSLDGLPVRNLCDADVNSEHIVISLMKYSEEVLYKLLHMGFNQNRIYAVVQSDIGDSTDDIEYKGTRIGRFTYGYKTLIDSAPNNYIKEIGRFCSINHHAIVANNNHRTDTVSCFPWLAHPWKTDFSRLDEARQYYDEKNLDITIGNDIWIGANAVILSGVHISDGAVIGAGCVVTRDVKPYEIVVGVPSRHLRYRFERDVIDKLLQIKWWDWSIEEIIERRDLFLNIQEFCDKFYSL